jgi:hypothetical protein
MRTGSDVPVSHRSQINLLAWTPHVRALMHTAWTLGLMPEYEHLGLGRWTHMRGFGGHVSSATRRFSTTFGALRRVRAEQAASAARGKADDAVVETLRDACWRYAGRGWPSAVLAEQAAGIWEAIKYNRELARDAMEQER